MSFAELGSTIAENRHKFTDDELSLIRLLWLNRDYVPAKVIALDLGIDERSLRGTDKEEGLRLSASRKLWGISDYKIISRTGKPSGIKLTNDPQEWDEAANQIEAHLWHQKVNADHYKEHKTEQMSLL